MGVSLFLDNLKVVDFMPICFLCLCFIINSLCLCALIFLPILSSDEGLASVNYWLQVRIYSIVGFRTERFFHPGDLVGASACIIVNISPFLGLLSENAIKGRPCFKEAFFLPWLASLLANSARQTHQLLIVGSESEVIVMDQVLGLNSSISSAKHLFQSSFRFSLL